MQSIKIIFMKKLVVAVLSLISFSAFAQQPTFGDRFSLEAGYGYAMPMGTIENGEVSDYAGFTSLHIGAHYHIIDYLGARLSYNFAEFQHPDELSWGSTYHRFTLAATYDVYGALTAQESPYKQDRLFKGIIYAGAGIGISEPDHDKSIQDRGLGIQLGIQPMYKITDHLSVFADAGYVINTMKDFGFDGISTLDGGNTSYVSIVLGLNYRFGK